MGVSLVCGLGLGIPHYCAIDGGCRFGAAAARPDVEPFLPASDWTDTRVRMELQRRKPAGPCLGSDVPVSHAKSPAWRRQSRFPEALFPQIGGELHLVGESEGPFWKEPL